MRTERRRSTGASILIEMSVIFCLLVSLGFPGQLEVMIGSSLEKMVEYAAFGLEILVMILSSGNTWQDIQLIHLDKKYLVLYAYVGILFVVSMLVTSFPSDQFITCARLLVTLLFAIWMQEFFHLDQILELFCCAQALFVLATIFFMIRYPNYAYESGSGYSHALCGLNPAKNANATEISFGILLTIMLMGRKIKTRRGPVFRWLVLLSVQGVLLIMCQCTGALFCTLIAVFPLMLKDKFRLPWGLIYITVNIVFLFVALTLMPLFEDIIVAMGKDATLTGRIPMWNYIINVMTFNRPLTGFGYSMFWRDPNATALIHTAFNARTNPFMANLSTGSHNVIIETWVNSGLIGLSMFFIALLFSFRRMKDIEWERYRFCSVVMTFLTLNGLTERCLGGNYTFGILSVLLVMAMGCNRKEFQKNYRKNPAVNAYPANTTAP